MSHIIRLAPRPQIDQLLTLRRGICLNGLFRWFLESNSFRAASQAASLGEHRIQLRHHALDLLFKFFDEVWNAAHPDLSFHELSQRYRWDSNHRTSVRNIARNT
jgi:hypothetical protein